MKKISISVFVCIDKPFRLFVDGDTAVTLPSSKSSNISRSDKPRSSPFFFALPPPLQEKKKKFHHVHEFLK